MKAECLKKASIGGGNEWKSEGLSMDECSPRT